MESSFCRAEKKEEANDEAFAAEIVCRIDRDSHDEHTTRLKSFCICQSLINLAMTATNSLRHFRKIQGSNQQRLKNPIDQPSSVPQVTYKALNLPTRCAFQLRSPGLHQAQLGSPHRHGGLGSGTHGGVRREGR